MKLKLLIFIIFCTNLIFAQVDTSYLNVISWNIQNLGKSKSNSELFYIAEKVKMYDIVAIQEVSTSEFGSQAIAKIDDYLDRTGYSWDYVISDPTSGTGSERYAFLFKKSRVKLKEKPKLETSLSEEISREPYKAVFVFNKKEYYFFNIHLVPKNKNPQQEVYYLSNIINWYSGKNIIICGDFNLSQKEVCFNSFKSKNIIPCLIGRKTSLKMKPDTKGKVLSQEYDNFFIYNKLKYINCDVIYFFNDFSNLEEARKISDHCPIKISLK
jgi:endonuclease/exonuclease/phosphatase family metal-dependent hydrolase